jgi:phosphonate transport system substrate-binding protein
MNRRYLGAAAIAGGLAALLPGAARAQVADPRRLRVGLLPDENASTLIQHAQPLKRALEAALGREIEIVVTTDYTSMIEAMRFNRLEIAYFGPFSYLLAKSRAPSLEPFAVGVERGSPTYTSVIIAGVESPVRALGDVRGHPFGFGDQASTSSHLVPRAMLQRRAGLVGGTDYRPVHLGTHDAVARAVQAGQVPAGALSKPILATLLQRGMMQADRLREVAESDPIPNYPLTMRGSLAPALKEQIRATFLGLEDPEVLRGFRVERFAPTTDQAYDVLRETAQVLQLDLGSLRG